MKSWVGNATLMLVALFLAFVVWFVVSAPRREMVSERAFEVPLSLTGMPRELIITTPMPDTVSVRLRGRVSDLRALSSKNLEVTIELGWAQPGEATVTIRPQAINVPPEIEVVSIDPKKMQFRIEQLRQRVVPIRVFLVGQPPEGYVTGDPSAQPPVALVSGPVSQVRNLNEVATERIIMTGRTETFVQSVAVVSDSPLIRVIEPVATEVTVPVLAQFGPPATATATASTTTTTQEKPPRP